MIGIPIGPPSQSPEPKSACTWSPTPIERTIASESAATGSLSTRLFQRFEAGKTGHFGADGQAQRLGGGARERQGAGGQDGEADGHASGVSAQADWRPSLALYSRFSAW